jgi:polyphosphate kinase
MEEMILREIDIQRRGGRGRMILKMNALEDGPIIKLLYQASQAGVVTDLIVRGACCLRPHAPGISENIHVRSVLGRFLEHSRIFYFRNNGAEECYLGSADLMPRNLNRRVEVLFPVNRPEIIKRIRYEILHSYLHDEIGARHMSKDGSYSTKSRRAGSDCQVWFLNQRTIPALR